MKVTVHIDEDKVAEHVAENTSTVVLDTGEESYRLDGYLDDVINSVIATLEVEVNRDGVENVVVPFRKR